MEQEHKERIRKALSHTQPDKLPIDFGSTPITGMNASIVYKLRQHYGLDKPGELVKVIEPYQMLGEIKEDLKQIIGVDTALINGRTSFFGIENIGWKPWEMNDGTPVLVPGNFNTERNDDGSVYQYPSGDKDYEASAKMPKVGYFFDAIERKKGVIEEELDPKNNLEEYTLFSDEDIEFFKEEIEKSNGYATVSQAVEVSFGDVAWIPGMKLRNPKGIRNIEEWYVSYFTRKDYIKKVFEGQMEIGLENLKRLYEELGDKLDVLVSSTVDLGVQQGLFVSLDSYRELFKPYNKKINDWIHENTNWKTFIHTDGSVYDLVPDLIEAGFDALNPVQISAAKNDPEKLKKEYGKDITFWGAGVNTQSTFMFGSPDEVREEVRRLVDIFSKDGGFVFSSIHNVQGNVPIDNVIALIETVNEFR